MARCVVLVERHDVCADRKEEQEAGKEAGPLNVWLALCIM
jgi:hypothetical protein